MVWLYLHETLIVALRYSPFLPEIRYFLKLSGISAGNAASGEVIRHFRRNMAFSQEIRHFRKLFCISAGNAASHEEICHLLQEIRHRVKIFGISAGNAAPREDICHLLKETCRFNKYLSGHTGA